VSVAESFIQDELPSREPTSLQMSVNDIGSVPGGLDPFITSANDEDFHGDIDPAGVSLFAGLIERLLARFELDATDTKITLVLPGKVAFTLSVPEFLYKTEAQEDALSSQIHTTAEDQISGEIRKILISGVNISAQNLSPPVATTPSILSRGSFRRSHGASPRTASPASSSSSLDEETQLRMSQSIVALPPKSPSLTDSMSSSMYQSAISNVGALDFSTSQAELGRSLTPTPGEGVVESLRPDPTTNDDLLSQGQRDYAPVLETILSFGTEPIIVRLTTPPPVQRETPPLSSVDQPSSSPSFSNDTNTEKLHLNVVIGVLGCALRAWHVRSILEAVETLSSHHTPRTPSHESSPRSGSMDSGTSVLALGLEGSIKLRGVVLLALPSGFETSSSRDSPETFFYTLLFLRVYRTDTSVCI
jgi:autophagy-related protein 2